MKNLLIPALILLASSFAFPQAATTKGPSSQVSDREAETVKPVGYEKVEDGECHTNGDGVKVCNTGTDGDDFKVDPKSGSGTSATTVDMDNNAEGTIEGLDSNDTVNVANGADVAVSGTGGTVNVPAGSSATGSVTNTNPAGGGGGNVTLVAGGVTVQIPPGGSVTFGG